MPKATGLDGGARLRTEATLPRDWELQENLVSSRCMGRAGSLSFPACWLCPWWAEDTGHGALSAGMPSSFDWQVTQWPCWSPGESVLCDSHLLSSPPSSLSPDDSNGLFTRRTRVLIKQTLLFRQLWDQEDGQVLPARSGLALIL